MNANNDEGKLISGKEALIALANGELLLVNNTERNGWEPFNPYDFGFDVFDKFDFQLKPKTITINSIEVPAPFEPEEGEQFWYLRPSIDSGYSYTVSLDSDHYQQFGAWRTEEEIKQVAAALRQVFGGTV